jgi:ABC-type branched-subunit amino acid transport system permease subunit
VVAVLVAIPAVRLRGFAFGIITLALPAFAVPLANRLVDLTGGSQGVAVVATTPPEWPGQADDQWWLYLVGVVAAIVFWLVLVPNVTDNISPGRSYLVNGICLPLVLFFFPGGLAGALRRLLGWARRRIRR